MAEVARYRADRGFGERRERRGGSIVESEVEPLVLEEEARVLRRDGLEVRTRREKRALVHRMAMHGAARIAMLDAVQSRDRHVERRKESFDIADGAPRDERDGAVERTREARKERAQGG